MGKATVKLKGNRSIKALSRAAKWAKLDALWREVVKKRAKYKCEWCGKPGYECHHMITRQRNVLRVRYENGAYLCTSCHRKYHNGYAVVYDKIFAERRPGDWGTIQELHNVNMNWKEVDEEWLESELRKLLEIYE